jgi:hypothetical protein
MNAPTANDMKKGTVIANNYGEWTVTKVQPYGWEVTKEGTGTTVVFEHSLPFYTFKG